MTAIAQQFTLERIPTQSDRRSRGPARKLGAGTWQPSSIHLLLKTETYTGILYYGKTENTYTHTNLDKKTAHRVKPKEEWLAIAVPPIIDAVVVPRSIIHCAVAGLSAHGLLSLKYGTPSN